MNKNVKSITTVSEPFSDGQRVTSIAIEYAGKVQTGSLKPEKFTADNRTITDIYVSDSENGKPCEYGNYVILKLDPHDDYAKTLAHADGKRGSHKPKPSPGGAPHRPPKKEPIVLPDGRVYVGPTGKMKSRPPLDQAVCQIADITDNDGNVIPAWQEKQIADREINKWSDLFIQKHFADYDYNLYIPEGYDPSIKYPLVLFIHDASCIGDDPRITLEQGIGATIWASEEEQKKHPCFVVAPQHSKDFAIANDNYWVTDDLATVKAICDEVQKEYSIDPKRVYSTGQSMGCMSTFELLARYPDYFAAGLPVAGHWDADTVAGLWKQNVWFFMCDADDGAARFYPKLIEALKKAGAKYKEYEIDADQPFPVLSEEMAKMADDGCTFRITRFIDNSVKRPNQTDGVSGPGHFGTWIVLYNIESVRDWLLKQSL